MTTPTPQLRAACYCRISSDPQDKKEGVDRQRADTTALCEVKGWTPVDFYIDNDRSASNGKKRPQWERLLADIRAGKIDAVAAWDQDRVNRTMDDFMTYKSLFVARGIKLATSNNGDIDLSTPAGELMATIKTAVSTHEVAMMRVRMRRAAVDKAEKGLPKWKHAFGYLPDTRDKRDDDGKRQLDPVVAPLVDKAYKAILSGAKLGAVCKLFNDAGAYGLHGKPWTPSTVSLFLRAPRNAGLRAHHGEIIGKGTWPPLVSEKTWRSVQAKISAPGRAPGKKSVQKHLLTGALQCGKDDCDGHLSGNWVMQAHRGGPRAHAITYACKTCRGVSVRAEHIEPWLYNLVGGRLAKPDAVDLLKAEIHDEAEAEAIRTELATLYADRIQIGVDRGRRLLNSEQAKAATDVIDADIAELQRRQNDADKMAVLDGIPLGRPEAFEAVRELSPDRFRAVVAVLMTVRVVPVGKGSHVFDEKRIKVAWK
jgi:DNA invertase Pin-like site-specific DNA recombinase